MSTLEYYNKNAAEFVEGSVNADLSFARGKFLSKLPEKAHILDLGCGSGRDTLAFLQAGYEVTAVDGSEELSRSASVLTGLQVRQLLFENLDYSDEFDGIWACSSLLHVPKAAMKDILLKVRRAVRNGGTVYLSYKYGTTERVAGERFFNDYTENDIPELLNETGLECVEWWLTEDVRPDRNEKWLNILASAV